MRSFTKRLLSVALVVLVCGLSSNCATRTGTGALAGGGIGAAVGSAVGDDPEDTVAGTIIGTAVGATIGAVADANAAARQEAEAQRRRPFWSNRRQSPPLLPQQPPRYQPAPRPSVPPVGKPTNQRGIVVSPYPPGNRVDVRNFRSGDLVKEPGSDRIFRVP